MTKDKFYVAMILTLAGLMVKIIGLGQQNTIIQTAWRRRYRALSNGISRLSFDAVRIFGQYPDCDFDHCS